MNTGLVSIIVPVYNVEKYLTRCLDSIINQTYRNLEILIVDDGSTDQSGEICDQYADKDARIRVFHRENGGLAVARNTALDKISGGGYLVFVDSDDYIELDAIEKMVQYAYTYNVDIVIAGFYIESPYRTIPANIVNDITILQNSEELMKMYLSTQFVGAKVWNKLYAKELWSDVRFPNYRTSEDTATSYKIFDKSNKSIIIPKRVYHYVMRQDSIEHKMVMEHQFASIEAAENRYNYVRSKYPSLENAANCDRWCIRTAMYKRLFMTNQQNRYKKVLDEWLDFFKKEQAPSKAYQKEQNKILKYPYAYGWYIGCKYRLKKRIKGLLSNE